MIVIASRGWTAARWTSENPVLPLGEIGIEHDTGYAKRGNGATAWTSLPYWDPNGATNNYLSGFGPPLLALTGEYWAHPGGRSTAAGVDGTLYTHPVWVPRSVVLDRIGAEVTTGAASSTVTLGVYRDNGAGDPSALLFDAGTIDGNSATAQEITINRRLAGPALYHFASLVAGGTPTLRVPSGNQRQGRSATLAASLQNTATGAGRSQAAIVGTSLPTTAVTTAAATPFVVSVRLA